MFFVQTTKSEPPMFCCPCLWLALISHEGSIPLKKWRSSSLRRWRLWESFEQQVSSQSRRDNPSGDPLLQAGQSLPDAWVVLEMTENVLLNQTPHPDSMLGPPTTLQLPAGQHGVSERLHPGPDLRDALWGVWGGSHHLRMKFGRIGCVNFTFL